VVNDATRTPLGLVHLDMWGSLRHASNAAFICLNLADLGVKTDAYRAFAKQQIGYILGDTGRSFVVGYGVNPPQKPHHRGAYVQDKMFPFQNSILRTMFV
jgi:endoglucanase